jgi:hypothetical protein
VLAQRSDYRRLGGKLRRFLPALAMTEAIASLGDADQVMEIKLLAHACQRLERQVQQGRRHHRGCKIRVLK